jgi:hypothetical protein
MSRRDKFIDALSGITVSMVIRFYCAICCKKNVVLEYTKFKRDYEVTYCCGSLVCEECSEREVPQKCSVCSKNTKIGLQDKSWLHLDGRDWKSRYALYEAWAKMWGRMPFLGPFTSRMERGSWLKVLQLHEERGEDRKKRLLAQYVEFEKNYFQWKVLFYTFRSIHCLPFVRTQQMLDFFDMEKCAIQHILRRKFILRRFTIGFMKQLSRVFSLDQDKTLVRRYIFFMILKRVLSKKLRW